MKKQNTTFWLGAFLAGVVVLFLLVGCFWTPYDPQAIDASQKLAGLSLAHPMGCDAFGRDVLSRVMSGGMETLLVATGTVLLGAVLGILLGAVTGYFGGILDVVVMRMVDALLAFPSVLLALVVIALLGTGERNVILSLGIAFAPSFARVVRGEFLRSRYLGYVQAAKLAGASAFRIIFVHILPNIRSVLLSTVLIGFNNAVLAEAALSYLGLGVQPPQASLGSMLSESQTYLFSAPMLCVFPGVVLILLVLGFGLMGDGLRMGKK
jgi:peptide/nickel transport system permease protein